MSMEVSNQLVSWFINYLWDLQPTYIGVIIHLLSTMDIPVGTPILGRESMGFTVSCFSCSPFNNNSGFLWDPTETTGFWGPTL